MRDEFDGLYCILSHPVTRRDCTHLLMCWRLIIIDKELQGGRLIFIRDSKQKTERKGDSSDGFYFRSMLIRSYFGIG